MRTLAKRRARTGETMATPMITTPGKPPPGGRATRMDAGRERRARIAGFGRGIRRNVGLKLLSLALAVGLWMFVNAGQHGALESFQAPISYRDLPPGFIITNSHPEFVRIQVSGPRTLLSLIDPARLTLHLDLTGVGIGQASFKIGPDSFAVPRQTSVTSVLPSQIVLEIDKIVTRNVAVRLVTEGAPAEGYKVAATDVAPAQVGVRGPSREVARVDEVETEPLAIEGISADLDRTVDLMTPGGAIRLATGEVEAKVTLAPVIASREFRGLPVQVRDTGFRYRVEPRRVTMVLRGPLLTLAKLDLRGAVYVEADGLTAGTYNLPVQVNLPDDVALVRQSPARVRVKMYREGQARNG